MTPSFAAILDGLSGLKAHRYQHSCIRVLRQLRELLGRLSECERMVHVAITCEDGILSAMTRDSGEASFFQ